MSKRFVSWSTCRHLNPKKLENPTLLARQLFAFATKAVGVVEGGNATDKIGSETESSKLGIHGVRERIADWRFGVWS